MRRRSIAVALTALTAAAALPAATSAQIDLGPGQGFDTVTARIVSVSDGRTLRVRLRSGAVRTVRLAGITVPVVRRNGAVECGALSALDDLVRHAFKRSRDTDHDGLRDQGVGRGKVVEIVRYSAINKKGRTLAGVVSLAGGISLNDQQLYDGWASITPEADQLAEKAEFMQMTQRAQSVAAGVWGGCNADFHVDGTPIY